MSDQAVLAIIGIVGAAVTSMIGIVSWTQRALLLDIQTQLRAVLAGQTATVTSVVAAVRDGNNDTDQRIDRLSRAVELSARVDLLRLIGSPEVRGEVKEQARGLIQEIHDAADPH